MAVDSTVTPVDEILDMDDVVIDPSVAMRIQSNIAMRRMVLPVAVVSGEVMVACADPEDPATLRAVKRAFSETIVLRKAESDSLRKALRKVHSATTSRAGAAVTGDGEEFVRIVDEMIGAAILRQASDIHIEPEKNCTMVQLRVDGHIEAFRDYPASLHSGIVSRIKVISALDIAEKRVPQDGQISYQQQGEASSLNIRVATIPVRHGEKLTLRLLGIQSEKLTLENLGMSEIDREAFEANLANPHGMILLTGPTGSGKTSTFYAALRHIQSQGGESLITIEDPVEYDLAEIPQVEVDADRLTYATALRSVLRHDPDVIMIGEIRDQETAEIAVRSAITGHLVLSTLHTNSAAGAVARLLDIGVPPFLAAATIRLVAAQRLVRVLCQRCRTPRGLTSREAMLLGDPQLESQEVYDKGSCLHCAGKGFTGRIGIFELLPINEKFSTMISQHATEQELIEEMSRQQLRTLRSHGLKKILAGETTVDEILRTTMTGS
ncbi:MAG: GspE/PulE family protein [Verrucomicrobiales bacterium]|nr:GspE/PulE family protein [Verrucomicrobiales bacterium]